jgi:hypothetical protein
MDMSNAAKMNLDLGILQDAMVQAQAAAADFPEIHQKITEACDLVNNNKETYRAANECMTYTRGALDGPPINGHVFDRSINMPAHPSHMEIYADAARAFTDARAMTEQSFGELKAVKPIFGS